MRRFKKTLIWFSCLIDPYRYFQLAAATNSEPVGKGMELKQKQNVIFTLLICVSIESEESVPCWMLVVVTCKGFFIHYRMVKKYLTYFSRSKLGQSSSNFISSDRLNFSFSEVMRKTISWRRRIYWEDLDQIAFFSVENGNEIIWLLEMIR